MRASRPGLASALALCVLGFLTLLYLRGAQRADPGVAAAREDLDILRTWIATGLLTDHPTDFAHLTKPGFLLYLRAALPHAGEDRGENRRFLFLNAAWILLGLGSVSIALRRRCGPLSELFFLLIALGCVALRDCADYVLSEPLAIGLALVVAAGVIHTDQEGARWKFGLGAAVCLVTLVRPNLGALLLLIVLLKELSRQRRGIGLAATLGGFILCVGGLTVLGRLTRIPLNPFGGSSRVLLWGTADYYWKPDIGDWPVGGTSGESTHLQLAKTRARWNSFFRNWNANHRRSLEWRLGHGILSAEELPSRWNSAHYLAADRFARRWWWAIATILGGLSVAAAIGGRGPWLCAPILVVMALIGQGLLFGTDPRLALPFLPLWALVLAAVLPTVRWGRFAIGGGAATVLLLFLFVRSVPDVAAFDFALVQGPGRRIEQALPSEAFCKSARATVHFRLLQEPPFVLGLSVFANGRPALRRGTANPSPWPASFAVALGEPETAQALHEGLRLRIETEGAASSNEAFVYYPVVPPLFCDRSSVDGQDRIPSGFGGETAGGLPVWVIGD